MSDLLTNLGSVVTAALGYVGNICTTIVSQPLLLMTTGLLLLGGCIGIIVTGKQLNNINRNASSRQSKNPLRHIREQNRNISNSTRKNRKKSENGRKKGFNKRHDIIKNINYRIEKIHNITSDVYNAE